MPSDLAGRLAAAGPKKKTEEDQSGLLSNLGGLSDYLNPVNLGKGIIGGMGGDLLSSVKGVAQMPGTVYNTLRLKNDPNITSGDQFLKDQNESPLSFLTNTETIRKTQTDAPLADKLMAITDETTPLVGHFAENFAQTGINLADLGVTAAGKGEHPGDLSQSNYGRAWNKGQLFPQVANDLINVAAPIKGAGSVAGGEAGQLLKMDGLGLTPGASTMAPAAPLAPQTGLAARLTKIGEGAEKGPFLPYQKAGEAVRGGIDFAANGGTLADTRLAGAAERYPRLAGAVDAGMNQLGQNKVRSDIRTEIGMNEAGMVNPIAASGPAVRDVAKNSSPAEQQAAMLVHAQIPDSTLNLNSALGDSAPINKIASPEAVDLARQYHAGVPEVVSKLDEIRGAISPAQKASEDLYVKGEGLKGNLTEQQRTDLAQSNQPLFGLIDKQLADTAPGQDLAAANKLLETQPDNPALLKAKQEAENTLAPMRDKMAADPDYAPARFRPALKIGQDAQSQARELATQLRDQGDETGARNLEGLADDAITTLQQAQDLDPGHVIGGPTDKPSTGSAPKNTNQKKIGSEFQKEGFNADLSVKGQYNAMLQRAHDMAMNLAKKDIVEKYGSKDAPVDPKGWVEVDAATGTKPTRNTTDTAWVPKSASKAMDDLGTYRSENAFVRGYDKSLSTLKMSWLPFSPKWQVGNAVGNSGMSALGSGVTPQFALDHYPLARELMEHPTAESAQVLKRGMSDEMVTEAGGSGTRLGRAADKMFRMNQFVDDLGHVMSYLKEKDTALGKGMTEKAAGEEAVKRSLSVMGDFTNMTKFERNVVRRIMPFYPWYRHITKLAWNLPIDNPARVNWTVHLADVYDPTTDGGPDYEKSAIPLPGGNLLRAPWNPFPGGVEGSPLLSPKAALGALTPAIQWPAAAFGLNLNQGRMLTQAPGNREDTSKMGFIGFKPLAGYLTNQFPQARGIADTVDAVKGQNNIQFDTREPMLINGKPQKTSIQGGALAPALSFLTGASVTSKADQKAIKKQEKKTAGQQKAAKKYQQTLERKGY